MTADFDKKIQPGMVNGLNNTAKKQSVEKEIINNNTSKETKNIDLGTGVAGRSSVNINNIDTDMRKFFNSPRFCEAANKYVEHLVKQGYNYEDAVNAVWTELGV